MYNVKLESFNNVTSTTNNNEYFSGKLYPNKIIKYRKIDRKTSKHLFIQLCQDINIYIVCVSSVCVCYTHSVPETYCVFLATLFGI